MNVVGVSASMDELANLESESGQVAFAALSDACARVAEQICLRSEATLPGITAAFHRRTVIVLGGQAHGAYGSYQPEKWQLNAQTVDEIHINVGFVGVVDIDNRARAIEIVDTIGHELAHLYARSHGIRDTSGRGNRYHNRAFAQIATLIGLRVEKSPRSYVGHITTGLTARGEELLGDLVTDLDQAMRLLPADGLSRRTTAPAATIAPVVAPEPEVVSSKYVSAHCSCRDHLGRPRTIRMARGWWSPESVGCGICRELFVESPPFGTKSSPVPHRGESP